MRVFMHGIKGSAIAKIMYEIFEFFDFLRFSCYMEEFMRNFSRVLGVADPLHGV